MTRTAVFECPIDGFRTSPVVFGADDGTAPGVDAASVQIAEHALLVHGDDESASFDVVDLPPDAAAQQGQGGDTP